MDIRSTSVIELSKSALENNLKFLEDYFGNNVKLSSVVKGNAYGHGIKQFIPIAEENGIDHFSVFSADEAYEVCKEKKETSDVMIMGWVDNDELEWVIENDVEFYVFEIDRLLAAIDVSRKLKKPALIHIEVETGMNRTGFKRKTLDKVVELIKQNLSNIIVKGLCTHYAGAESIANHVRVQKQYKKFNKIYNWLIDQGIKPEIKHTASSAAAMTYPKTQMDMVRIGIMQYGFWPGIETFIHYINRRLNKTDPLERVISWKSTVMTVKTVNQGEFISYGTTYFSTDNKKIAVIPIGYSHGYNRSLSNTGTILINGNRVNVIGMVNMNMLIADVSNLPDVEVGDEVVLVGTQGDHTISVASFTVMSEQINYELLVRLPASITRIVTD